MTRSDLYFFFWLVLSFGLFWPDLSTLVRDALAYPHYSHILAVPGMSVFFIYGLDRKNIFQNVRPCLPEGALLVGLAGGLYWLAQRQSLASGSTNFSLTIVSVVLFWMAGFLMVYGRQAFRLAAFPLLLLLLVIPLPEFVLARVIYALQKGSADVSYVLFAMVGVPVFRDGFFFTLPGLTIEVAEECSGIRSSTALFILCLLIGHLFLRSSSRKVALLVSALPILIFKNAVRIVTISLLSAYVSRDFLTGWLHQSGGVVFFLLGLAILVLIIRLLEKSESKVGAASPAIVSPC